MKQHKKMAIMLVALLLTMAWLSGCGNTTGSDESSQQVQNDVQSDQGGGTVEEGSGTVEEGSGDFHDALPEDFEITIMVNDWDGNPNSGDHSEEILQMLEEHTGYKINVMWVPSDGYDDRFGAMLAGGKEGLPKIMVISLNNGVAISSMANGAFQPIEDYIYNSAAYPNLSQATPELNQLFTMNGHLYGVYGVSGPIGRFGMGYRQDWAERLGIDEPKTVQDVYDMLYAFTYNDPDGNGIDDTYGLNLCRYTGPLDIMQTWFGCGNKWVEGEDGTLIPVHMTSEYMDALNWFKKLYDDGLITSDWAIRDTATWIDDNYNGVAGAYIDCTDNNQKIWDYYINNQIPSVVDPTQTASMMMVPGIAKDAGSEARDQAYPPAGGYVITQAAESEAEVQACLEFLDKMCDDEALMLALYGLEGIHWELDENNEVVRINPEDTALHKAYNGLNQLMPYIPNRLPSNYTFAQNEPARMAEETYAAAEKIAVFNPAASYLNNSPTYTSNGGNLDLILDDARTQYIVGDIDEAGLQSAWDLWLETGGQTVIDEVNEQYLANK